MKIFYIFLFLFYYSTISVAQTMVSGGIYTNTTWTSSASPYLMEGPVVVFPGVTLTIQEGVKILVKDSGINAGNGENYLEVRGKLKMIGSKLSPIVWEANTQKNQVGAWYGIKIMASQGAQIQADYFHLANTNYGIFVDNGVLPDSSVYHHCKWSFNNYAVNVYNMSKFDSCIFSFNNNGITGNLQASSTPWISVLAKWCSTKSLWISRRYSTISFRFKLHGNKWNWEHCFI